MLIKFITYAEHHCKKNGCGIALVVDGNMKNHRYVCSATHAGYVEFKGLNGKIRSGCPKTPAHKSSYCSVHTLSVAVCQNLPCDESSTSSASDIAKTASSEKHPVGKIIDKRVTRNSTLYKVHVHMYLYALTVTCEQCETMYILICTKQLYTGCLAREIHD